MQVTAKDILYQAWEEIPLKKLRIILQLLPVVIWQQHDDWMNTYSKNLILKLLFRDAKLYKRTSAAQRVDLYTYELDWLKKPSYHFPIQTLKLKDAHFYAPNDGLTDLSVEQLAEADTRLSRYIISNKAKYLDTFIACLYTRPGDVHSLECITEKSDLIAKAQDFEKISIVRAYLGSRIFIMKQCPNLFPDFEDPSTSSGTGSGSVTVKDLGPMWDELIYDLANTKGYTGVDTAKGANAVVALRYLDREIRISKEQQAKHPRHGL